MATKQEPIRRTDVVRCETCGEDYSITYKRCPFCDERPGRSPRAGTGAGGRITEKDVQALIDSGVKFAPAAATAAAPEAEYEDVKFSGIRRAISKSMTTSLHSMAQLTHNTSFDATNILKYRKQL